MIYLVFYIFIVIKFLFNPIINKKLENDNLIGKKEIVQFHKKFSYEDFIEGFSPDENGNFYKKDGITTTV